MKKKINDKFYEHDSEGGSADYMGIGHSGGDVAIWAYVDEELLIWTDLGKNHIDVLKDKLTDYWRGRYEGFTNKISVVCPSDRPYQSTPSWLKDKLTAEFGEDIEFHSFNPPRRLK